MRNGHRSGTTVSERIEPTFSDPALRDETLADIVPAAEEISPLDEEGLSPTELLAVQQQKDARRVAAMAVTATAAKTFTVAQAHARAVAMRKTVWGWITKYEASLSAVSMIGGFAFDNYCYRRIDLPNTQLLFLAYLLGGGVSIILLHAFEARAAAGRKMPKWHSILPMATQFALGCLWSAFLIFYTRGAVLAVSWPFLLVLVAIFIGNEVFKKYHSQLVFTAVLYFFALISYCIVTVPIFTHGVGTPTFLLSGIVALGLFWLFLRFIKVAGGDRWKSARWQIGAGAIAVFAVLNAFYFTGSLPPLPVVLANSGVYHFVKRDGDVYQAQGEDEPWFTRFGATPVIHVAPGQPLYVYSAVFAPIRFHMAVVDHWKHYNRLQHKWATVSRVKFSINGGRDGGYRNYTIQHKVWDGDWRVDVDTADGRIIGRIPFTVVNVPQPITPVLITLK
jgi:hypothetical protein